MSNETHIYGHTSLAWAVGQTREEVIKRLAEQAGKEVIQRCVDNDEGLLCSTCVVELPINASYAIENYQPHDVPVRDWEYVYIQNVQGDTKPYRS